jgi:hypothetical protein
MKRVPPIKSSSLTPTVSGVILRVGLVTQLAEGKALERPASTKQLRNEGAQPLLSGDIEALNEQRFPEATLVDFRAWKSRNR